MEEQQNIFIRIMQAVFHLASVFVRGTLFYFCKILYLVFKLDEFESEDDDEEDGDEIYEVISDLSHSFNFKRSKKFEDVWEDYTYYLSRMIDASKADAHNGNTDYIEEIHEHIEEDVKVLIVLAEKEALNRSFKYYSKQSDKAHTFDMTRYMFDETLNGYDTGDNEK